MTRVAKQRLDVLLVERGMTASREKAQALIMAGEVLVEEQVVAKAGLRIPIDAEITLRNRLRFVSRGGEKLDAALTQFGIATAGVICADVGASTGGFTDCLLQHGAARVYAIDVGYGQLAYTLRTDPRVVVIERTNARYLDSLPEPVDFIAVDASFISLKLLLPVLKSWARPSFSIVPLIKPQFEAGRENVGKGGVVRDPAVHTVVLENVLSFAQDIGLHVRGLMRSPLKGPAGNVEFLAWLSDNPPSTDLSLEHLIKSVV
jgi:23S rRNA (cytidine1920-2'-O)/16S rRNA (cytidine1409-2'-O)-methyltransferase